MSITLRLFGWEIVSFEWGQPQPEDQPAGIGGASAHDFERDMYPPNPDDPYRESYDGFGFGR